MTFRLLIRLNGNAKLDSSFSNQVRVVFDNIESIDTGIGFLIVIDWN